MKRLKRVIEVFEGKFARVEVEGNTCSVQLVDPETKTVGAKFAIPILVAMELSVVLSAALAQSGDVVNETNMVVVD